MEVGDQNYTAYKLDYNDEDIIIDYINVTDDTFKFINENFKFLKIKFITNTNKNNIDNFKILYEDIYKYSQNHLVNFIEKNILNFKIYKNHKSGMLYNFLDYNNKLISITIEELKYIISSSIRIKFKLKPEYIYWIKKNDNNTGNIVYNITNISILNKDEKIILDLLELRNIHNKNKEKTDIISDLQYIYNNGIYFEKYKKYTSKRDIMNTLC